MLELSRTDRFDIYQTCLHNALAYSELANPLKIYGYSSERLLELKKQFNHIFQLHSRYLENNGLRAEASELYQNAYKTCYTQYMYYRKLARLQFGNAPESCEELHINASRPKKYAELKLTATHFYKAILKNKNILNAMSELNCKKAEIKAALEQLKELEHCMAHFIETKQKSKKDTIIRQTATKAFDQEMSRLRQVCTFAFKGTEPNLRKLGFNAHKDVEYEDLRY